MILDDAMILRGVLAVSLIVAASAGYMAIANEPPERSQMTIDVVVEQHEALPEANVRPSVLAGASAAGTDHGERGSGEENTASKRTHDTENSGAGRLHWNVSSEGGLVMKADGSDAEPVRLAMCFSNMTGKTLKLDAYAPFLRHALLEVTGPDEESVVKVPDPRLPLLTGPDRTGSEFPTLRHGHAYDHPQRWAFPGVFLDPSAKTWKLVRYQLKKPGKYHLRFRYVNPAPLTNADVESGAAKWSKDCWTGELVSSEFDVWVAANYGPVETEEEARKKAREHVATLASEGRILASDLSIKSLGKIRLEKRGEIPIGVLAGEKTHLDDEQTELARFTPQYYGPDVWLFHCQSDRTVGYICIDARTGNACWNQLRPQVPVFDEGIHASDATSTEIPVGTNFARGQGLSERDGAVERIMWGEPKGGLRLGLAPKTTNLVPGAKQFTVHLWYQNCNDTSLKVSQDLSEILLAAAVRWKNSPPYDKLFYFADPMSFRRWKLDSGERRELRRLNVRPRELKAGERMRFECIVRLDGHSGELREGQFDVTPLGDSPPEKTFRLCAALAVEGLQHATGEQRGDPGMLRQAEDPNPLSKYWHDPSLVRSGEIEIHRTDADTETNEEAVKAVSCRLHVDRTIWKVGEPLEFAAEVCNTGPKSWTRPIDPFTRYRVEVDGRWYGWVGQVARRPGDDPNPQTPIGKQPETLLIKVDWAWQGDDRQWLKCLPGK
ncbi:MAG: hypothetical protein JJ992_05415, partial [Planctomycetes bacterium]|nr:hypothetical protein [Planctomycetota bacterium]